GLFGLALLIFFIASPIVWFFTEQQWYDSLGFRDVFTTRVSLQIGLVIGGFALAFIYLVVNVIVALRVRSGPSLRAVGMRRSTTRRAVRGRACARWGSGARPFAAPPRAPPWVGRPWWRWCCQAARARHGRTW